MKVEIRYNLSADVTSHCYYVIVPITDINWTALGHVYSKTLNFNLKMVVKLLNDWMIGKLNILLHFKA